MKNILLYEDYIFLNEGGAFGHLSHIYEVLDFTFSDLKELISLVISGKFSKDNLATEKIDGINLFITYYRNEIYAVRNRTQIKDGISKYFTIDKIKEKFEGRGAIKDAFVLAMIDLKNALLKLSSAQLESIFGTEGKCFLNIEIVYPETQITIPYDFSFIVLNSVIEFSDDYKSFENRPDKADILAKIITDINQHIQKTFTIRGPVFLEIEPFKNSSEAEKEYLNRLQSIMKSENMANNNTLYDYYFAKAKYYFRVNLKLIDKDETFLERLFKRLVYQKTSYLPTQELKQELDEETFEKYTEFENKEWPIIFKKIVEPINDLFIDLGIEVLIHTKNLILGSKSTEIKEKILKEIEKTKSVLKNNSLDSEERFLKLSLLLKELEKYDLNKILPTEGVVFSYKGKLLKFTGLFSVVHRFINFLRF